MNTRVIPVGRFILRNWGKITASSWHLDCYAVDWGWQSHRNRNMEADLRHAPRLLWRELKLPI